MLGMFLIVGIVPVASTRMLYSIHPRQTEMTRTGGREAG